MNSTSGAARVINRTAIGLPRPPSANKRGSGNGDRYDFLELWEHEDDPGDRQGEENEQEQGALKAGSLEGSK